MQHIPVKTYSAISYNENTVATLETLKIWLRQGDRQIETYYKTHPQDKKLIGRAIYETTYKGPLFKDITFNIEVEDDPTLEDYPLYKVAHPELPGYDDTEQSFEEFLSDVEKYKREVELFLEEGILSIPHMLYECLSDMDERRLWQEGTESSAMFLGKLTSSTPRYTIDWFLSICIPSIEDYEDALVLLVNDLINKDVELQWYVKKHIKFLCGVLNDKKINPERAIYIVQNYIVDCYIKDKVIPTYTVEVMYLLFSLIPASRPDIKKRIDAVFPESLVRTYLKIKSSKVEDLLTYKCCYSNYNKVK